MKFLVRIVLIKDLLFVWSGVKDLWQSCIAMERIVHNCKTFLTTRYAFNFVRNYAGNPIIVPTSHSSNQVPGPGVVLACHIFICEWEFVLLLKVSKSRKQIYGVLDSSKNEKNYLQYSELCSFFGRIEDTIYFFEIYWPLWLRPIGSWTKSNNHHRTQKLYNCNLVKRYLVKSQKAQSIWNGRLDYKDHSYLLRCGIWQCKK
jgi:hypothetical protein